MEHHFKINQSSTIIISIFFVIFFQNVLCNVAAAPPKSTVDGRIVGGVPAKPGEFKSKISVQNREGDHLCGGTLIDATHIVTAADCLTDNQGRVFNATSVRLYRTVCFFNYKLNKNSFRL